jgi:hypothetical protein
MSDVASVCVVLDEGQLLTIPRPPAVVQRLAFFTVRHTTLLNLTVSFDAPLTPPVTDPTVHLASQSDRIGTHHIVKLIPRRWFTHAASQHTQI